MIPWELAVLVEMKCLCSSHLKPQTHDWSPPNTDSTICASWHTEYHRECSLWIKKEKKKKKALRTKTWYGKRTSSSFTGDLQQSLSKWAVVVRTVYSLVCEAAMNNRLWRHVPVFYHMILLLMTGSTFRQHSTEQSHKCKKKGWKEWLDSTNDAKQMGGHW